MTLLGLRQHWKKILFFSSLALFAVGLSYSEVVRRAPDPRASIRLLDRNGVALEQENNPDFGPRLWVDLDFISPYLVEAVLQQEDRRFYQHWGIDPKGLGRALLANFKSGGFVQGGSTITQQLAKILLENYRGQRASRNLFWKSLEALLALDCEWHWSKKEILERYLNSVYLGNRLYGVEAASLAYFGKSSRNLDRNEALALATHLRRPNQKRALFAPLRKVHEAPHMLAMLTDAAKPNRSDKILLSTLDADIQKLAQQALNQQIEQLHSSDPQLEGAVVVIDVEKSELLALVGSSDFKREEAGQFNHATALRQPGSTLKPFTYFLAFLHHRLPSDQVIDAPYHFLTKDGKTYSPRNFDRRFHGILPIREALANSLNVPAVLTQEEIGTSYYLELLHRFGLRSLKEGPSFYGLSLTLGSGSVSLVELSNAYAALARGAEYKSLKMTPKEESPGLQNPEIQTQVSDEERRAAFLITNILSDPEARRMSFGDTGMMSLEDQQVAVKTGTSHDSRDAWAVGYTPGYVVGVWMGHSDNSPMPGFTGAEAAVPVWHQVMAGLGKIESREGFKVPTELKQKTFCMDQDCKIAKLDWSSSQNNQAQFSSAATESFRLIRPAEGEHFLIDEKIPRERQQILCEAKLPVELQEKAKAEQLAIRWMVNGKEIASTPWNQNKIFLPLNRGRYKLQADVGGTSTKHINIKID